ncbi:MAG: hypothetical protein JOZ54_13885 [Acidobacteria bacterium]|nr:hypothetical protein [Acidobacteriota bacterium]
MRSTEFWKHEVRTLFERHGGTVTEESPLGGGRSADLRAARGQQVRFVEVETGRSDLLANLAKYAPDVDLVVFCTSSAVADRYREVIGRERPSTRRLTPAELDDVGA